MWVLAVIVLAMLGAESAAADILSWRDASGVTHYTNLEEDVPSDQRTATQVVVREVVHHPSAVDQSVAVVPVQPEPPRQAEVIPDRESVSEAYVEGLVRGLEAARAGGGGGGSVQINGPLAVANATAPAWSPGYWPAYGPPLLTTSFDRGRSRHLTLRLLLQDQFAYDREGPYTFERLGPPLVPLSVNLNPFQPNGLPHGFPRMTRVITR